MRLHEILTEDQILAEAILTEFDWNKLKKGLATGLITLSALGIAGNALAADGKTYTASEVKNMSVSDLKNFVVKQVQQGNTDTSTVQAAVQQPKAASLDNKPEAKPKAAEPKQDVKPEIKKDEPKKAAPDELDTVKKNAGIEKSKSGNLSAFSIKGLRFGMSFNDVVKISGATDRQGRVPDYWFDALENFSIAGETGWYAMPTDDAYASNKGELGTIFKTIKPDEFETHLKRFTQQYGKPEISKTIVKNKMNFSDTNITAYWKVKDAYILIEKYSGKFTEGAISMVSDKHSNAQDVKNKEKNSKSAKDF
jgi:hypothetical protein